MVVPEAREMAVRGGTGSGGWPRNQPSLAAGKPPSGAMRRSARRLRRVG